MTMWCMYLSLLLAFASAPSLVTGARSHVIERRQSQDDPCSFENYLQQDSSITQECVMRLNASLNMQSFEAILRDGFCDPTCAPSYHDFLRTCFNNQPNTDLPPGTMIGSLLVEYYVLFCGNFVNRDGHSVPCYSFLNEDDMGNSESPDRLVNIALDGVCASALNDSSTCTTQCTEVVRQARTNVGCCINNLLNTSYFRIADPVSTRLVDYDFWNGCGVETPSYCPVAPEFQQFLTPEVLAILNAEATATTPPGGTATTPPPGTATIPPGGTATTPPGGTATGVRVVAFDKLLYVLVVWVVLIIGLMY